MKKIRTRYAPSPTGHLHIGGARTALFCYLFAKHYNGDFIVRMEDTDIARNIPGGEKSQLDNLAWLGIIPDESPRKSNSQYAPYRQSEKIKRYNELINKLIDEKKAYKAYDTIEEIQQQKKEQEAKGIFSFRYNKNWLKLSDDEIKKRDELHQYTIRLSLKKNHIYKWDDLVRGSIEVNTRDIGDWVIRKQDGFPTYNFAVVVDDHDMQISHVLRGEEHTTNTPKQLAIYDAFGWEAPKFGHLTIITNQDGQKLSKRDKNLKQFIDDYKKEGYIPEAVFNFLALLGWTHPQAKEILTRDQLINAFDWKRLSKSPSKFSWQKMAWFSKEYIKIMPNNFIIKKLKIENQSQEWKNLFVETYKHSCSTIQQLEDSLAIYNDKSIKKMAKNEIVKTFAKVIFTKKFNIENIKWAIKETQKITNTKGKMLFMPIRLATTYQEHGPELATAIYLFGKTIIKERLT